MIRRGTDESTVKMLLIALIFEIKPSERVKLAWNQLRVEVMKVVNVVEIKEGVMYSRL